jgi:hypothetical protein
MKTLIEITLFSPFVVKTPKREKSYEVKSATRRPPSRRRRPAPHHRHLKKHEQGQCRKQPTRQESASCRGRGRAGRQGRRGTLERLVPLAVNNLLVALHNLKALIHHIQTLFSAPACGKDIPEHLQDVGVGSRSGRTPSLRVVQSSTSH